MEPEKTLASGFTLLEVLVTVFLLALFTSVVSISLMHSDYIARLASISSLMSHVDNILRHQARLTGRPATLRIGTREGTFTVISEKEEVLCTMIPHGIALREIRVLGIDGLPKDFVSIECSPEGLTPSYSVCLGDRDGKAKCFLFAGLTGQWTESNEHERHTQLFERLERPHSR